MLSGGSSEVPFVESSYYSIHKKKGYLRSEGNVDDNWQYELPGVMTESLYTDSLLLLLHSL